MSPLFKPGCGRNHNYNQTCPASGKVCNWCKKPNHFSNVCLKKRFPAARQNRDQPIQPLYNINEQQQEEEENKAGFD